MNDVRTLRFLANAFADTAEDVRVMAFDMLDDGKHHYAAELDGLAGGFDELADEVLKLADLAEMHHALPAQRALVAAFAERLGAEYQLLVG